MGEQQNSVAYVPDFAIFRHGTTEGVLDIVKDRNYPADAVCLPIIQMGGIPFETQTGPEQPIYTLPTINANPVSRQFHQVVSGMLESDKDIYFYVNPSMEYLNVPPAHVLDIRNVGSPKACFNKVITQRLIVSAVTEAFEHIKEAEQVNDPTDWGRFKGVAIDVTNLWGMGAEEGAVQPTCFCSDCRKFFEERGLKIEQFETSPSPFMLALRPSDTGVSYIDNFSRNESLSSIVGKSKMRGFSKAFGDDERKLNNAAGLVLQYMQLRHDMVLSCLDKIFGEIKSELEERGINVPHLQRIIVVEGSEYNWTGGIFFDDIASAVVDEVWFDPTEKTSNAPKDMNYRYFTATRSTYFLNAFFQIIANAKDPVIRSTTGFGIHSEQDIRRMMGQRAGAAVGRIMNNIFQLGLVAHGHEKFQGFVRPTINDELAKMIVADTKIAPSPLAVETSDGDELSLRELLQAMTASGRGIN